MLHLAATLTPDELAALPAGELLRRLFHEEDVRLFEPGPVFFQCTCSRERVSGILRSLGEAEVRNRAWQYYAADGAGRFAADGPLSGPRALQ